MTIKLKFTLEIETEKYYGVTESQAAVLMLDALNESFPSCIIDENKDIVFCVKTWYFEQVEND